MRRIVLACMVVGSMVLPCLGADAPGPAERPAGTGVIVHRDGYILTAHHVVANARRIVVVMPGEFRVPALIVGSDPEHDLALLKVETVGLSEAPLGYAGAVTLDEEVIVAGFPFGLREVSVVHGRVSAVRAKGVKRVFQLDAAINPGNSGGPVFNRRGEVIALVTTKFSHPSGIVPEGMGFAVPISYALPLLANIPEFDFTSIGKVHEGTTRKGRKGAKAKSFSENVVPSLSRMAVRVETVRVADSLPTPVPSGPFGSHLKAEGRRIPPAKPEPEAMHEPTIEAKDEADVEGDAKVRARLAVEQRQELQALADKGLRPPEGMMVIPAGEFLMGSDNGLPDARPLHRTVLSTYWIDTMEVTNAQYGHCVSDGVCAPPKDRAFFDDPQRAQHPVSNVTWRQAHAYCQWRGARLPTEAEWEKAARGTDGRRYPWGNAEEPIKRWIKDGAIALNGNGTMAVGTRPDTASPYGVLDLVGNAWEWVRDWYAEDYYAIAPHLDPQGPLRGAFRVLRGGDWRQSPLELRASYRAWDDMSYWGPTLGFRCAADVS
jgi:formylglycine-generating enzyme required for sulfatase activity